MPSKVFLEQNPIIDFVISDYPIVDDYKDATEAQIKKIGIWEPDQTEITIEILQENIRPASCLLMSEHSSVIMALLPHL